MAARRIITTACALALAASVLAACSGSSATTYSGTYLSLGDSVAAGNGASDKSSTSFVADLARDEHIGDVRNLAVAGATTQDVIDKQLLDAVAALEAGKVGLVTISAGGNDLAALIPNAACQEVPLPASCPLDDALAGVESRLDTVMRALRDADGDVQIALLLYPNFFSGTGHPFEAPAARVLPRLDEVIGRVARRYQHTALAAAAPAFEGQGATLTHVLDPNFDPHPNDAGHRAIADAFEAALRDMK